MSDGAGSAGGPDVSSALARVLAGVGGAGVVEGLSALSGSDFTTLMLEVARRRASRESPASVLRRYRSDRFVQPGRFSWRSLSRIAELLVSCLPAEFDVVTLAPLVPLGTHSTLGTVSQDKIITALRACEASADPTSALALEAAVRRLAATDATVRLAGVQRIVRAQQFSGGAAAHFSLLGLVTAGRDRGSYLFERDALAEHTRYAIAGMAAAGAARVQVALTPLSAGGERVVAAVMADLSPELAEVFVDADRRSGRGYYRDVCFKVNVLAGGRWEEIGDGGFTDWTQALTTSRKERLLISGLGIDRLAGVIG
jgi:hypothetical protein